MATNILGCEDVVREISSYLPISDIISLVECGTRRLNYLLTRTVEHCLVKTARDMDVVCMYMKLFPHIRRVYVKGIRMFGGDRQYTMPKHIEVFIASKSNLCNLVFGSDMKYIKINKSSGCVFGEYPETSISLHESHGDNDDDIIDERNKIADHVTHAVVGDIRSYNDYEYETIYPRLKKIDIRDCPSNNAVHPSQKVNMSYVCGYAFNGTTCTTCGVKNKECIIDDYQINTFEMMDGVKTMSIYEYRDEYDLSTVPQSVKSLCIMGGHIIDAIHHIPKSVTNLSLPIRFVTSSVLNQFYYTKSLHITDCKQQVEELIRMVIDNGNLQIETIAIIFDTLNEELDLNLYNIGRYKYYISRNIQKKSIIFERIRYT